MKFALLIAILLLVILPLSAFGQDTNPDIEIKKPIDGSTVGPITTLEVYAEGHDLENPHATIYSEDSNAAVGIPLTCQYSEETGTGFMTMKCDQELKLKGFTGKNIVLTASVEEGSEGETIRDKVGLFVSEESAQGL